MGASVASRLVSINFSKSANSMGDIWATAPWWLLFLESLSSFSTGTKLVVIFSCLMSVSYSKNKLPLNPFWRYTLLIVDPLLIASMIALNPNIVVLSIDAVKVS